MLSKVLNCI